MITHFYTPSDREPFETKLCVVPRIGEKFHLPQQPLSDREPYIIYSIEYNVQEDGEHIVMIFGSRSGKDENV